MSKDEVTEIRCVNMTQKDWVKFARANMFDLSPEAIDEVLRVIERDLNIKLVQEKE